MTDDPRLSTIRDRVALLLINGVSVTTAASQAQRGPNRLLCLYTPRGDTGTPAGEDVALPRRQIAPISGHLLPLQLTDAQYPIEEHARLAADVIRRTR